MILHSEHFTLKKKKRETIEGNTLTFVFPVQAESSCFHGSRNLVTNSDLTETLDLNSFSFSPHGEQIHHNLTHLLQYIVCCLATFAKGNC